MFSIDVAASLHTTSYLRGRLAVRSEIREPSPNSVTTGKTQTCLLNCTYQTLKQAIWLLTQNVSYLMCCDLCKDHEVSHGKNRAVSLKPSRFTGGSVSVGLSWVTSSFPTYPPSSLYRSQDNRTNVCSILKLYSFSQDKQEVIRLVWCFSNCKSFKTLHK